MLTPEQAIHALQQWLRQQVGGSFKSIERRLRTPAQVINQPALFLMHESNEAHWADNSLEIDSVSLKAWVYAKSGPTEIPDRRMNELVKEVAEALAPDDGETGQFTLGGLVSWCRIDGVTEFFPGDLSDQAMAIVPIKILLTI